MFLASSFRPGVALSMNRQRVYLDRFGRSLRLAFTFVAVLLVSQVAFAGQTPLWSTVGPDGGDARALAADPSNPNHLYLGTTTSWIYESSDGGASWHRLAKLDSDDSLVVDHIIVDPAHPGTVYAAAWSLAHPGGGLWVSHDGGRTFDELSGLHGQ